MADTAITTTPRPLPPLRERERTCAAALESVGPALAEIGALDRTPAERVDMSRAAIRSALVMRVDDGDAALAIEYRAPLPKKGKPTAPGGMLAFYPWRDGALGVFGSLDDAAKSGALAPVFRRALAVISRLNVVDFHMQVWPQPTTFVIFIAFGDPTREGPNNIGKVCHSCDVTTKLARTSFLGEAQCCRAWIDAKARPMVVVTPVRHVNSIADLSDDELAGFLALSAGYCRTTDGSEVFVPLSWKINHGTYRNWEHLHLKITFTDKMWAKVTERRFTAEEQARAASMAQAVKERSARKKRGEPVSASEADD